MPAQVIVSGAARATHACVIVGGAARYVPQIYVNVGGVIHALYSYYWALGAWGGCSAACGGGVQYRSVTCARNDGVIVGDEVCSKLVGGKPGMTQGCNTQSCVSCRYSPISFIPYKGTGVISSSSMSNYNCWVYILNNVNMVSANYCVQSCTLIAGALEGPESYGVGGYKVYETPACGNFYKGNLKKSNEFWADYEICGYF